MPNLVNIIKAQRQRLDVYSVVLVIFGVATIWFYLNNIRLNVETSKTLLYAGVALCSIAITLAFLDVVGKRKVSLFATLFLFILAYGLLTLYSFRYDAFGNWDIIGEYVIADKTDVVSRWPWTDFFVGSMDRPGRYASCLSVTILPGTLAKMTGIDVLTLFRFGMPLIGAILPLVLFLAVKEIFSNEEFAFLTATLFAVSHLFIFSLSYQFREQIGFIFLLLSVFVFLRFREKPLITLIPLTGLVLADAGHVASTLTYLVLLGFIVAPFLSLLLSFKMRSVFSRDPLRKSLFPVFFLVYYSVLTYVWLSLFASSKLTTIVGRTVAMIPEILSRIPEYVVHVITTGRIFPSGSTASGILLDSPILKYWYYVQVLLTVAGLLFSVFWFRRKPNRLAWTISGLMVLLLFLVTVLAPWYLPELDAGRTIGAPVLTAFLALPLWLLWRGHLRKRIFSVLIIPFLIFLFVSLPINMSLTGNSRVLHYTSEGDINPLIRANYPDTGYLDLKLADWIKNYVSEEKGISEDLRGFLATYLAYHTKTSYVSSPNFNLTRNDFLILPDYYVDYGLWIAVHGASAPQNTSTVEVLQSGNVICNNGQELFIARLPN